MKLLTIIFAALAALVAGLVGDDGDRGKVKAAKGIKGIDSKAHPGPARMKGALSFLGFIVAIAAVFGARVIERNRDAMRVEDFSITGSIFGTTWYVDTTNGANTNTGKDPKDAFATLLQARTSSAAGDSICIAPGDYTVDVSSAGLSPKADQLWYAANPSYGGAPSVTIAADADDSATTPVLIDVDNVVFKDVEFKLIAGGTNALYTLDIAQTSAVRGGAYIDCWFNLNDVDAAVIAVRLNDATNDADGLVFRECRFVGGSGTTSVVKYIQIGVGGATSLTVEGCAFELESADGDCAAIDWLDPTGANKSYGHTIRFNTTIGPKDGGGDSIPFVYATAMTDNELVGAVHDNILAGASVTVPITQDEASSSIVKNYTRSVAGGAIVDPTA